MANYALFSLAFSAGLISFMNPCGFALLPVYITYYFKNEGLEKSSLLKRIFAGLLLGLMVSLGFAAVFSIIGILVSYLGRGLLKYVGWFDLFIGLLLVIVGFIYLFNMSEIAKINNKYLRFPSMLKNTLRTLVRSVFDMKAKMHISRITNFGQNLKSNKLKNKYLSFFIYGIGFAIASLGCTLPIFLLVVTTSLKSAGFLNGLLTFLIYAAGMSFFMILFSLAVAVSKTFIEKALNRALPYIYKLGPIIVIIAGVYLMYSQIVFGRLLG